MGFLLLSADLIKAFDHFFQAPRCGEVYNMGGGRPSHCSMLEAIDTCQQVAGRSLEWKYSDRHRKGDHIWWVSNVDKFRSHYPEWQLEYDIQRICREIYEANAERWLEKVSS